VSSVAYMDVVIGVLATVALLVALPFVLFAAGGWSGVIHALPASHFRLMGDIGSARVMEIFLPTMLLMLGNQSMYQKFFSARSERDARVAVVGWIIGTVILETVIVALAVCGSAIFPTGEVHERPREILAFTAMHGVPLWLGVLIISAIFAKIISTANNYLFSPATNLVNDIFSRYIAPDASNKRVLIISRLMVVLLGLWALGQSFGKQSVLAMTLYAYTIYAASLTPVILAAFYSRRATAWGAVSAIGTGTFVTVIWDLKWVKDSLPEVLAKRDAIFPALALSLLALIVVSAVTPKPRPEQVAQFLPE